MAKRSIFVTRQPPLLLHACIVTTVSLGTLPALGDADKLPGSVERFFTPLARSLEDPSPEVVETLGDRAPNGRRDLRQAVGLIDRMTETTYPPPETANGDKSGMSAVFPGPLIAIGQAPSTALFTALESASQHHPIVAIGRFALWGTSNRLKGQDNRILASHFTILARLSHVVGQHRRTRIPRGNASDDWMGQLYVILGQNKQMRETILPHPHDRGFTFVNHAGPKLLRNTPLLHFVEARFGDRSTAQLKKLWVHKIGVLTFTPRHR